MPQIIPIRDLKNTSKLYEQKISLLDAFTKLEAAETNVQEGKVLDAEEGLISIRKKYSV